jgi:hypothetical protein
VKPIPEDNPLFVEAGTDVPEKIASFYHVNDVRRFQLDRPVHKGPVDKDNEFKVSVRMIGALVHTRKDYLMTEFAAAIGTVMIKNTQLSAVLHLSIKPW